MRRQSALNVGIQLPLGFSGGLPLYLTGATLTAWLTDAGVSMVAIGAFSLVALPYNAKVLWAPLLDRFVPPWLGRRRGWILVFQVLLALALAGMSAVDAGARPEAIALMAVAVATLSASQDICIDAYRIDLLDASERGKGSAAYVTGYRAGMIVASAGALILADVVGWQVTYLVLAGLMLVNVVTTFLAPATEDDRPPRTLGDAIVKPFVDFFTRRGALLVLAIVALYKFGDAMASHMITPFLLDIDFSKTEIGLVQKFGGLAATIVGAGVGGALADRIGVVRALLIFGLLQALANVGYVLLALQGPTSAGLAVAVVIDNLANGMGTAAFMAWLMSLCDVRYSATQYALLVAASSLLARFLGATSGYMQEAWGWSGFFVISIAVAAPALLLILVYRRYYPKAAMPEASHE